MGLTKRIKKLTQIVRRIGTGQIFNLTLINTSINRVIG